MEFLILIFSSKFSICRFFNHFYTSLYILQISDLLWPKRLWWSFNELNDVFNSLANMILEAFWKYFWIYDYENISKVLNIHWTGNQWKILELTLVVDKLKILEYFLPTNVLNSFFVFLLETLGAVFQLAETNFAPSGLWLITVLPCLDRVHRGKRYVVRVGKNLESSQNCNSFLWVDF